MAESEDTPPKKKAARRKSAKPASKKAPDDAPVAAAGAAAEPAPPPQRGYEGLARRWRPQSFEDLVGQEEVARSLANSIRDSRIAQGHIMAGPRGVGKTTSARILARALNCESGPTAVPCGKCRHCRDIATGNDLDVIEIDAASNTQVDKMRELLERVVLSPFAARRKVYIIDEVHMLSTGSFNALLKTLEEPPRHVVFIFATTELDKIPETVRSRCTIHTFRRMSADDIVRRLAAVAAGEGMEIDPAEAREIFGMIARASEGGMRDALVSLDQVRALTGGKPTAEAVQNLLGLTSGAILADLVGWLADGNAPEILRMVEEMVSRGRNLERFVKGLLAYLHDLMLIQAGGDESLVKTTGEALDRARELAARLPPVTVFNMLNQIFELEARVRTSTQVRFLLEFTLLRMSSVRPVVPIDDLIRRIKALPDDDAPGASASASPGAGRQSARPASTPSAPPPRMTAAPSFRDSAPEADDAAAGVINEERPGPDFESVPAAPAAAQPLAASAPSSGGSPHALTGLSRDEIIDYLTPRMPAAQQFLGRYLRQAVGLRADESRLYIQWNRGERTASGMLSRADNRKAIEETLTRICGRPVQIEFSFSTDDAAAFAPSPRPRPAAARPAGASHFADSAPAAAGEYAPDPDSDWSAADGFAPPPEAEGFEYSGFDDSDFAPEESMPSESWRAEAAASPDPTASFAAAQPPAAAAPEADAVVRVTGEEARRAMAENPDLARRAKMVRDFFNGSFVDSSGRPLAL